MSGNKAALMKRREKDIFKLRSSNHKLETCDSESTYLIDFCGPEGTPYEMGKWTITLYLPDQYPYKSPSVGFLNKIYHPNIDYSSGSVCLDVINQTWTPMYQLLNIFQVNIFQFLIFLPQLLTYPNPSSPLNQQAAQLYEQNQEKYNETVRQCINKYALNKQLVQERKKSEEILQKQNQKEKQMAQLKGKGKIEQNQPKGEQSMDEEGSQLSQHDSILDNDDLKLY